MKKILFLATVALATLSLPAEAQKPDKQTRKAERSTTAQPLRNHNSVTALAEALQALTLTEAQNKKLEGAAFKLEVEILGMLTPEQQAQFKEAQERLKKPARGNGKESTTATPRSPLAELQESLKLTAGQKDLTDPIFNASQKQLTELEDNVQKSGGAKDPQVRKEATRKFKELTESLKTRLRSLLNPTQQTTLDAWKPRMRK
jgi:hypothetical protein